MPRSPRQRLTLLAAVLVLALVVAGIAVHRRLERADEWRHGGDGFHADVRVALGEPGRRLDAFGLSMPDLGPEFGQSLIVRVGWRDQPRQGPEGYYVLLVLDDRVTPPRPIATDGGAGHDGRTGSGWDGRYNALAEHYPWLARTADVPNPGGGFTSTMSAVHAAADGTGWMAGRYRLRAPQLPLTSADQLLVAGFLVRDGEVRWATRLAVS
ncbi:hypothetical protein AB0J86_04410 [Micromonospora sp. NPDC049559]|uniref:hypothetical protein n=1 Tax=Micromonospora sp. NPDC049559 TaxID=3155923 RepID=UPI00343CD41E